MDSFVDLGYAKPDLSRKERTGACEVIYGEGKTAEQIVGITQAFWEAEQRCVFVTRMDAEVAKAVQKLLPAEIAEAFCYHNLPRCAVIGQVPEPDGRGYVGIAAAGTSDLYAAEEAALTAEVLGSRVKRFYDVGVAGIHRLLAHEDELRDASCIVAVAGMEGALPSVVGGLVSAPVIACPTSVGYGANFGGLSALLGMLTSCASGVSVVNIDNGFGAGYQAAMIDHVGMYKA